MTDPVWLPLPYQLGQLTPLAPQGTPAPADTALLDLRQRAGTDEAAADIYAGLALDDAHEARLGALAHLGWSRGGDSREAGPGAEPLERFLALAHLASVYSRIAQRAALGGKWHSAAEAYDTSAQAVLAAAQAHARFANDQWPADVWDEKPEVQRLRAQVLRVHAAQCALAHLAHAKTPARELVPAMRAIAQQYGALAQGTMRAYAHGQRAFWLTQAALCFPLPGPTSGGGGGGGGAHVALCRRLADETLAAAVALPALKALAVAQRHQADARAEEDAEARLERGGGTLARLASPAAQGPASREDSTSSAFVDGPIKAVQAPATPVLVEQLAAKATAWALNHPAPPPRSPRGPPTAGVAQAGAQKTLLGRLLGSEKLARGIPEAQRDLAEAVALRAVAAERVRVWKHGAPPGTGERARLLETSAQSLSSVPPH